MSHCAQCAVAARSISTGGWPTATAPSVPWQPGQSVLEVGRQPLRPVCHGSQVNQYWRLADSHCAQCAMAARSISTEGWPRATVPSVPWQPGQSVLKVGREPLRPVCRGSQVNQY